VSSYRVKRLMQPSFKIDPASEQIIVVKENRNLDDALIQDRDIRLQRKRRAGKPVEIVPAKLALVELGGQLRSRCPIPLEAIVGFPATAELMIGITVIEGMECYAMIISRNLFTYLFEQYADDRISSANARPSLCFQNRILCCAGPRLDGHCEARDTIYVPQTPFDVVTETDGLFGRLLLDTLVHHHYRTAVLCQVDLPPIAVAESRKVMVQGAVVYALEQLGIDLALWVGMCDGER